MPGTVIAVIVLVGVYLLVALIGLFSKPVASLVQLAIGALILVGLIRGHALAWQWGMVIPILSAVFVVIGTIILVAGPVSGAAALGVLAGNLVFLAFNIAIPVLLTLGRSRAFFGLQCPSCGKLKARAANFLFTKARCSACRAVWPLRA